MPEAHDEQAAEPVQQLEPARASITVLVRAADGDEHDEPVEHVEARRLVVVAGDERLPTRTCNRHRDLGDDRRDPHPAAAQRCHAPRRERSTMPASPLATIAT